MSRCYVDSAGDLVQIDTNETLRRATAAERQESRAEFTGTGAIRASVSHRTLARRWSQYRLALREGWIS